MARRDFQAELEALHESVLDMAALVRVRLADACTALIDRNARVARSVITADDEVNKRYLDIESDCISVLASQQPVAGDLRAVVAAFKIITDLERIADLATNVAGYALAGDPEEFPEIDLGGITGLAIRMVDDAVAAYEAGDDEWACREVAALDDDLDAQCEHASTVVVRYLLGFELERAGSSAGTVDRVLGDTSPLLYTIRDVERIGDHAVNIAGRTLYMVQGTNTLTT